MHSLVNRRSGRCASSSASMNVLPNEIAQWLLVGAALKVQAQFYAISLERKIEQPAVLAICERASEIFPT